MAILFAIAVNVLVVIGIIITAPPAAVGIPIFLGCWIGCGVLAAIYDYEHSDE